ncbi:hypothetical protein [Streptomyces sp. NPDC014733]|uniref:hypothetical protein n=1 Tax=Streptomyces sp. NPDC014733 TaxID=3364885 RepID=UPI003701E550
MPGTVPGRRRRGAGNGAVVLALAAVGTGGWLIAVGARATAPQRPPAAPGPAAARTAARDAVPPPSPPVRLRIPAAGTGAPPPGPGPAARGALRTPPAELPEPVGRFRDGVPPGCPGAAVSGPAASPGPAALPPRSTVAVRRADGRTTLLTVDATGPRNRDTVLGDLPHDAAIRPEFPLLTCGNAGLGVVPDRLTGAG